MNWHNDFVGDVEWEEMVQKNSFFVDPVPLLVSSQSGCPTFTSMMQWGPRSFFLGEFYDVLVPLCNGQMDFVELYLKHCPECYSCLNTYFSQSWKVEW